MDRSLPLPTEESNAESEEITYKDVSSVNELEAVDEFCLNQFVDEVADWLFN